MASEALGQVYLIPCFLDEETLQTIPAYVKEAVQQCRVFFVENERSARRYLRRLWKEIVIDDYEWHVIHKAEEEQKEIFRKLLQRGMTIGVISEAGCPGIADPGQLLVEVAQKMGAPIKPLVGPSSILLALMASGMNGQQFCFHGYLPIDNGERTKVLRELEQESTQKRRTQIFIETPYRNNQLLETILKTCKATTQLCIAADLTGSKEYIRTFTIEEWKKQVPDIHKRPCIFLLYAADRTFLLPNGYY